jgi:hypothetical protein
MGFLSIEEDHISDLGGDIVPHNFKNPKEIWRQYHKELRNLQGFSVFSSAKEAEEYEKNQSESMELDDIPVLITSN